MDGTFLEQLTLAVSRCSITPRKGKANIRGPLAWVPPK